MTAYASVLALHGVLVLVPSPTLADAVRGTVELRMDGMAEGDMDVSVREVVVGGVLSTGGCEFES